MPMSLALVAAALLGSTVGQPLGRGFSRENVTGGTGSLRDLWASSRMAAGVSRAANLGQFKGEGHSYFLLQIFVSLFFNWPWLFHLFYNLP